MKIGHLVAYPDGSLQFENLSQDVNIMEDYDDSKFMRRSMIVGSRTAEPGLLVIYDEFRNISGHTTCTKLFDIVRQFGKLSGEKCYNKRLFVKARLLSGPFPVWKILVKTDQFFHEQGW